VAARSDDDVDVLGYIFAVACSGGVQHALRETAWQGDVRTGGE
jgi:hypothetical protein